ncbi:MAG: adenylyltransferase/cytidyltransferase family protein [Opitutales bacterium]|nr:adenylyltransferase/cytidyltransferase family protein [Opitutales bacterium]
MIAECYISIDEAVQKRSDLRKRNKTLALTNGCFDLLHAGHVHSLKEAAKYADHLWVALNSDESIKILKGKLRPIITQKERAYMLSALSCVDEIVLFSTPNLKYEILKLKPDYYIKSADYSLNSINKEEKHALKEVGAEIKFVSMLAGKSTTDVISKITQSINPPSS